LSPSVASSGLAESRVAILQDTRRWLLLLLISQAWLFAALVGAFNWSSLSSADRLALVMSAFAIVAGWLLSRRTIGLVFVACGPLTLVGAAIANGGAPSAVTWIAVATSVGHVTYALVLLTRPAVGIASIVAGTTVLIAVWSMRPGNVVAGGLVIAEGRVQFASLAASALALWIAWHWLVNQARDEDASTASLALRLEAEQEMQEQSRVWRAATVAVHERLLSTLRYLLQEREPDRVGLRELLGSDADESISGEDASAQLRRATAARIASGVIRLDPSVIDVPLSTEAREATRAAVIECALNAVLHGGATEVLVSAVTERDHVEVRVCDNGTGIPAEAQAGFGWTSVLDTGLGAVGGTWLVERDAERSTIVMTLPNTSALTTLTITDDGFTQGRLLLSAPLLAVGAVGVTFNVLALTGQFLGLLALALYIAGIASGAFLIRRGGHLPVLASTAILGMLAIIPAITALKVPDASSALAVVGGLVTAGYAIIAIALWCRPWQFIGALAIWAGGMVLLASVTTPDSRQPLFIGLVNCLVIVPIVVVVTSIATRRFRRMQLLQQMQRDAMRSETLRAHAESVIDTQLSACVVQAEAVIGRIADGAQIDADCRRELACLEGLIRATIQIDPLSSGEFARTAARLCNAAFNRGIPAQVGTLISSPDPRPIASSLEYALDEAIGTADVITVRTVTTADEDHLALHLHGPRVHEGFLLDLAATSHEDIKIEIDRDTEDGAIVMLTRRCALSTSIN
jgi:anti-sigma regulatory factor (Ser/Thr protein kinase)